MPSDNRERAILVGLDLKGRSTAARQALRTDAEESMDELVVLTTSAGADVVGQMVQSRESPESSTLIGSGKVEELRAAVETMPAELVIFDRDLTPTQLRNLENALPCRVIDRTQLILDIFAARARTREGQLQVELAQLSYMLPRLTGRGAAMSRLGGGIGTRGPGETQLETDRRIIGRRIRKLGEDLEAVRSSRSVQRRQRQAVPLSTIALVGYTNAGKSTIFNKLTQAAVVADARMFATLDPTVRHFVLPSNRRVLLSDTVGFIRNLPTTLVRAFRATLEEVTEAALLLHVVDIGAERAPAYYEHVQDVLREIGAEATPQLLVLNKLDEWADHTSAEAVRMRTLEIAGKSNAAPSAVAISARTGEGMEELLRRIDGSLPTDPISRARFRIPHGDGNAMHMLHEHARVLDRRFEGEYLELDVEAPESLRRRLEQFVVSDPPEGPPRE
ncbi:MAG TPA: GTPase HflX [Bryobacteraceae bacterium]|nr:GTPase HflX [Bryobacteraceae bacterium]